MNSTAPVTVHDPRCVCRGRGYWFAGGRQIDCRYRPCISCGHRPYEHNPALAGKPMTCKYCLEAVPDDGPANGEYYESNFSPTRDAWETY